MQCSQRVLWPAICLMMALLAPAAIGGAEPSGPSLFVLPSIDESLVCYGPYSNVALGTSGTLDDAFCSGSTSTHFGVDGLLCSGCIFWWQEVTVTCNYSPGHYVEYDLGATYELGGTGVRLYTMVNPLYADDFQNIRVQFFEGPTAVWISNVVSYNPADPTAAIILPTPPIRADRVRIVKTALAGGSFGFFLAEVEIDGRACADAATVPTLTGSFFAFLCAWLVGLGCAALALVSQSGRTRS